MRYFGFQKNIGLFRLFGFYVSGQPNCTDMLLYTDEMKYTLSHIKEQ